MIVIPYHIISHHIIDLKRHNRLKVGTDKPKLKVKMQSVSDDDVRKRLREMPRFELEAKGVFRLGRCYWEDVTSSCREFRVFGPATGKARLPTVDRLTDGTRRRLVHVERSDRQLPEKTAYWHERSKIRRCTSVKNSECQQGDLNIGYSIHYVLIITVLR